MNVPTASNRIEFEVEGPGEIVATDNGDPTDMKSFSLHVRAAFNGKTLVIIRPVEGSPGIIRVKTESAGRKTAQAVIESE